MIKVGIVGATGYTARQLLKILLQHPETEIVRTTSRSADGTVYNQHPELLNRIELPLVEFDVQDFVSCGIQCAFSCLPHAASAATAMSLLEAGISVVDFSADYRLNDWKTFETWYQVEHPDRERVGSVAYGLPEIFREQIVGQKLIANPGCFPTSALLPITPLVDARLIDSGEIIVDSKTGISGAGRSPKPHLHFPECNDSISAYGVGTHRHAPEIEQIVKRKTGKESNVIFTPHLAPMDRGILSTIYVNPINGANRGSIEGELRSFFSDEPFVRIASDLRSTKSVRESNFCDITVKQSKNKIVIVSCIDNLVKGASGAAVQNFNLMFGLPETMGLI